MNATRSRIWACFVKLALAGLWLHPAWATQPVSAAEPRHEAGLMLREGEWRGYAGTYTVPRALAQVPPSKWPVDGWSRITLGSDQLTSTPVPTPRGRNKTPAFLRGIQAQVQAGQAPSAEPVPGPTATPVRDEFYLRVPGVKLQEGPLPVVVFQNGTRHLKPRLDHRYALQLGEQPFSFTVRNGLRGRNGAPYGEGTYYTIHYNGTAYEYSLQEFGEDSQVQAITDLDGDGLPDFVISVSNANSRTQAVLLSSTARPGRNLPTASLSSIGC